MRPDRLDQMLAAADRRLGYRQRAERLTDRLIPLLGPVPHGFYQREAFVDRAQLAAVRRRLSLYLEAKIRARAEGTEPAIKVPANADHVFGPGCAMVQVAEFIEAQKAIRA